MRLGWTGVVQMGVSCYKEEDEGLRSKAEARAIAIDGGQGGQVR